VKNDPQRKRFLLKNLEKRGSLDKGAWRLELRMLCAQEKENEG
jgi:hypothetical protein